MFHEYFSHRGAISWLRGPVPRGVIPWIRYFEEDPAAWEVRPRRYTIPWKDGKSESIPLRHKSWGKAWGKAVYTIEGRRRASCF